MLHINLRTICASPCITINHSHDGRRSLIEPSRSWKSKVIARNGCNLHAHMRDRVAGHARELIKEVWTNCGIRYRFIRYDMSLSYSTFSDRNVSRGRIFPRTLRKYEEIRPIHSRKPPHHTLRIHQKTVHAQPHTLHGKSGVLFRP